jgi:hypothetical protein
MARMTVTMTDDLYRRVRAELPGLNVSGALQEVLRAKLACDHADLACRACGGRLEAHALVLAGLARFYGDCLDALEDPVAHGATAEGAARVLKSVADRHHIEARRPLPRPTRAERNAVRDQHFVDEQQRRPA